MTRPATEQKIPFQVKSNLRAFISVGAVKKGVQRRGATKTSKVAFHIVSAISDTEPINSLSFI